MMIDIWLNQIAASIQNNMWIAPFLALLAGILTSFTPCSLSNIPLIIGYVGSAKEKIQKSLSVFSHFCIGNSSNICFARVDCNIGGKTIG